MAITTSRHFRLNVACGEEVGEVSVLNTAHCVPVAGRADLSTVPQQQNVTLIFRGLETFANIKQEGEKLFFVRVIS